MKTKEDYTYLRLKPYIISRTGRYNEPFQKLSSSGPLNALYRRVAKFIDARGGTVNFVRQ